MGCRRHCRYGWSACCLLVLLFAPLHDLQLAPIMSLPSDQFCGRQSNQPWLLPPPPLPPPRPLLNPLPALLLIWRLLGLSSTLWGAAESVSARKRAACSTLPPPRPLPLASVLTRTGALATAHEHAMSRWSPLIGRGASMPLGPTVLASAFGAQHSCHVKAAAGDVTFILDGGPTAHIDELSCKQVHCQDNLLVGKIPGSQVEQDASGAGSGCRMGPSLPVTSHSMNAGSCCTCTTGTTLHEAQDGDLPK